MTKIFDLHLVSDASGEIAELVARAVVAQLENVAAERHLWNMVRDPAQIDEVLAGVAKAPGIVLHTVVNPEVREALEEGCQQLGAPCLAILQPIILAMSVHLDAPVRFRTAGRHVRDADYFRRIEAMRFILNHDDGLAADDLDKADVVLFGVSRTSKTPTCVYLANRGLKAANVPVIPGLPLPQGVTKVQGPLKVGLTIHPELLVQLRRERLGLIKEQGNLDYTDMEAVSREVAEARRLFARHGWPVVDVTRKSIEETAATILQLYERSSGGPY